MNWSPTSGQSPTSVQCERPNLARNEWEEGLRREVMALLTKDSSSIRDEIQDRVDGILLRTTLEATGGNISRASGLLGISRPTLRTRMRQLRIEGIR